MRNLLLGSTAVALVGSITSAANAAEWEVRIGGFVEQYAAYGSSDGPDGGAPGTDFDGIDSKQNSEIHFLPSITLDNGITIGAQIELEGEDSGDQIDQSNLTISGSFGDFVFGSENSVGYQMMYAGPDVTFMNINSGSVTQFIPFSGSVAGVGVANDLFYGTLGTTFLENNLHDSAQRFSYYTPRFAGFQLGVSYARDGRQDDNTQVDINAAGELHDIFDIGVNYVETFGDFSVALSARWGIASLEGAPDTDPTVLGFGANFGYAGFTVGGSWAEQNESPVSDGTAWDVGLSYVTGPWGFSVTYVHGNNFNDECAGVACGALVDEELDQFLVGVRYELATGVTLNGFGAYIDFDEEADDAGAAGGNDVDGFVIGTGIKLEF